MPFEISDEAKASLEAGRRKFMESVHAIKSSVSNKTEQISQGFVHVKDTIAKKLTTKKVQKGIGRYCKCPDGGKQNPTNPTRCDQCQRQITMRVTDYPDLVKLYSKTNKTPIKSIALHTNKKYYWRMPCCDEDWLATPGVAKNNTSCAPCREKGRVKKVSRVSTNPKLKHEYSNKNKIPASEVLITSTDKVWWSCVVCKREWRASPVERSEDSSCPNCNLKNITFLTSHPKILEEYHSSNTIKAKKVSTLTKEKLAWKCHNPRHKIYMRTFRNRLLSVGCPECARHINASSKKNTRDIRVR